MEDESGRGNKFIEISLICRVCQAPQVWQVTKETRVGLDLEETVEFLDQRELKEPWSVKNNNNKNNKNNKNNNNNNNNKHEDI